jgi:acetyl esterase/lipase
MLLKPSLHAPVVALAALPVVAAAVLLAAAAFSAEPAQVPDKPPPGYTSKAAVVAAIAVGSLPLADTNPPLPEGVKHEAGIEYGKAGDRPLLLDLYSPEKIDGSVPGLIFIHGGAWRSGKREDYRVYTIHFAKLGYVAATVSYRFLPAATFPAQIEDVKCAVRWMRSQSARIHVDPERMAVLGGSAGGHLALLAAYSPGKEALEGKGCNAGVSSRVAAVVDFYGPTDLTTPFARAASQVKNLLGGKSFEEAPDLYRLASPLSHLTKEAPPTLIFHGTIDDVVPVDQADALAAKLKELGVPHEYARLEGWPHTMDLALPVNEYCKRRMAAFLQKHLNGSPSPSRGGARG